MFKEFEITDFEGMATNIAQPKKNQCILNKNLDVHEKPGTLTLRPGYELKYTKPYDARIQSSGFISFENFYDKTADPDGQEITVLIQKGTVATGETDGFDITDEVITSDFDVSVDLVYSDIESGSVVVTTIGGGTTYDETDDYTIDYDDGTITVLSTGAMADSTGYEIDYVSLIPDTQTQPNFWARPSWGGSTWVNSWEWLNEVVITKVKTATHGTTATMLHLTTDKADDYFVGWTIWNKTQDIVSQIITSKFDSGGNRINHTLYNSDYLVDDVIYLFKNYINPTYLEEMNNATAQEIVFHNVLNDLRIGFGGKENRVGLSIGYRNKYFKIKSFDFSFVHADLDTDALVAFSHINGLILDEYSFLAKPYGIGLTESDSGTLDNGIYNFRLTGLLDDNSELLLAEDEITTTGGNQIEISPHLTLGKHNKRITDFKVYYSTDEGKTYHKIFEVAVSKDSLSLTDFIVDDDGKLVLGGTGTSIPLAENAVSVADTDRTSGWSGFTLGLISTNDAQDNFAIRGLVAGIIGHTFQSVDDIIKGESYNVSIYSKVSDDPTATIYFANSSNETIPLSNEVDLSVTTSYVLTEDVLIPTSSDIDLLVIKVIRTAAPSYFYFDILDISVSTTIMTSTTTPGTEISAAMGYTPSFNLVQDWEQCLVFNGRGHYLNPYIEVKRDNFIMKSAISAGWMYDAVTNIGSGIFNELDKFDGSKTVGMALLPNADLLILKDQSAMIIDPDTNLTRDFGRGKGCIARESIVTLSDSIMWCGLEDIYMISPSGALEVHGILDKTIRDLYLADRTKNKIIAIRDKYNAYRFRLYNAPTKKEYMLTDRGWIEQVKYLFVNVYRIGFNNQIWFSNLGDIYAIDKELDIPVITDPSDIADLTLYYKAGILLFDGGQDDKIPGSWRNEIALSKKMLDTFAFQTIVENGIEVIDFNNSANRRFDYNTGASTDAEIHPFSDRGIFTTIAILRFPDVEPGWIWYNNYGSSNVRCYISMSSGGIMSAIFEPIAGDGRTIVTPDAGIIAENETLMFVLSFDYNTKEFKAILKGASATGVASNYTRGSLGTPFNHIVNNNEGYQTLDLVTYDRILPNNKLNQLGVYFSDRWGISVWDVI